MECLQVIEGLSEDLCTVALAHTSDSEADSQPDNDQFLNIYRIKEHVKQQLLELQRTIMASEESTPLVTEEDKLIEANKELEDEIEFAKVSHQNKTLTLQRIQLAHSLRTTLEENGEDSKHILDMLKSTLQLCSSILSSKEIFTTEQAYFSDCEAGLDLNDRSYLRRWMAPCPPRASAIYILLLVTCSAYQYCRELEDKLIQVRKERLILKEAGEIMSQIQSTAAKQKEELNSFKNAELERLQGVLQEEIEITTIAQNILQKIVIGSRVNWAQDPKLKGIALSLEKNPVFF